MMEQQATGFDPNVLFQRLRRLATLDTTVFDEVRGDSGATIGAIIVAVVSTLLFGLGGWLWWVINGPDSDFYESSGDVFLKSLIFGTIISVILWFVWVGVTYVLLSQVFKARADVNELIRVMGFATAPLALGLIMFIPMLEYTIGLTAVVLLFGTTFIAVQAATDAPAGRSLVSVAAGFVVWALILSFLVSDTSVMAPGFFIFETGAEFLRA